MQVTKEESGLLWACYRGSLTLLFKMVIPSLARDWYIVVVVV